MILSSCNRILRFRNFPQTIHFPRFLSVVPNFVVSKMSHHGIREDFSLKIDPQSLIQRAEDLVKTSNKVYDSIAALPDEAVSYTSVVKALNEFECEFRTDKCFMIFPRQVSTDQAVRDASTEAEKILKTCEIDLSMRQDVFNKLLILEKKNEKMIPEAERYFMKLIKDGKRNGLHLSKETREEISKLKKRISDLAIDFGKHLNEVKNELEVEDRELEGVPKDFIENLKKSPETGKRVLNTDYPMYFPVMKKCRNPETRQKMYLAFNTRCIQENECILKEARRLRHKLAQLLGYPNYTSYICEVLMVKSSDTVKKFQEEMVQRLAPLAMKERKAMLELKEKECQELNIPFNNKLDSWDSAYYNTKIEETQYAIDKTKLQEYFPMHVVTEGLLNIYQELLSLKFTEVSDVKLWHEDVRMFKVEDNKSGVLMGYFLLDMFPRPGKYGHACAIEVQLGLKLPDGSRQISVVGMLCNFTKPQPEKPSLLEHSEVETFFHEFGHVMHYICSQADFARFANWEVERDFVEAPSQMLENWVFDRVALGKMSSHYKTRESIPEDLVSALFKSRLANIASFTLRQCVLATFDQLFHSDDEGDMRQIYKDLNKRYLDVDIPDEVNFACTFFHIMIDYEAQYYSYLWSKVYSEDMFYTRFKDGNNLFNPEIGMDYRLKILKPGGTKDAIDMLEDFLGRKPTMDAFFEGIGLKA